MDELKKIIAGNISELRKNEGLTQAELAQRLHYSDKAVSKWERGESVPDVSVLKKIADMFGVTVDSLLVLGGVKAELSSADEEKEKKRQLLLVELLWMSIIWIIAAVVFIYVEFNEHVLLWMAYVWAVPATCVVGVFFNRKWGEKRAQFIFSSVFIWTLLLALYFQFISYNILLIFLIGVPIQAALVFGAQIAKSSKQPVRYNKRRKGDFKENGQDGELS